MSGSYKKHVQPVIGELAQNGSSLDLVCVSHIDQDHIAGVLQLMNDKLEWAVYDYQHNSGNNSYPLPKFPRPPEVKKIWHNSFHEQLEYNTGPIEEQLAYNAGLLSFLSHAWAKEVSESSQGLISSMGEAVKLSRRIGARQLNIPLNPDSGGTLMLAEEGQDAIQVGALSLSVIGPFKEDLDKLRNKWKDWLKSQKGKNDLKKIRSQARKDEDRLGATEFKSLIKGILAQASGLGDREKVTAPNLASLMLLVEEDGKTILLTGDGHCDDIIKGLKSIGKMDDHTGLHVDVLKVQHHGSEHNTNAKFCRSITADHYVFCGNGSHNNPDMRIVRAFIDSRIGPASKRSDNPQTNNNFKLWFNSSSSATKTKNKNHMKKIEKLVKEKAQGSQGKLTYQFLNDDSMDIALDQQCL
jgi:beta-lactamase superfamily II metal-dependent hydrolase